MKARLVVLFAAFALSLGGIASSVAQPSADVPAMHDTIEQPTPADLSVHPNNKICPPPKQCAVWGDPPRDHVCLVCV